MAKTFRDTTGRAWAVDINVDSAKRVKTLAGFDLLELGSGKGDLLATLIGDPIGLVDVVFAVVKPDADARGVSAEEFGRSMSGDTLDEAASALLEAVVDFFPRSRRPMLAAALGKTRAAEAMAVEKATKAIEAIDLPGLLSISSPA